MMLNVIVHLTNLRWSIPAGIMLGSAPTYLLTWFGYRVVSLPLSQEMYMHIDSIFYSFYQRIILFFFEPYHNLKVSIYGSPISKDKKENVLYICNHQSVVDWIVTDMLAIRCGQLGDIRYVLKNGLRYFPLYGFYFRQHGCVYVKRSGLFNLPLFSQHIECLRKNPFWMVVFPEGTRYNPENKNLIAKSQAFAEEKGLQVFHQVLTPRPKATYAVYSNLKKELDAVYDITIAYSSTLDDKVNPRLPGPSMPDFINHICPEVHVHLDRIPIEEVPENQEDFTIWLHERFSKKDEMLTKFYGSKGQECFPDKHSRVCSVFWSTFPLTTLWIGINVLLLSCQTGRRLFFLSATMGTAASLLWMTFTNR